ncbi:hypothetical protein P691DRAFT_811024 [Macrolepiota fuliginosa MF-IS2]|uniref:Uncharacterized protein n=1 Tax=Macrolepiota fuliginosa MF-IS2 TaxID=1400762 RepID=A0A9P5X311_9AGAR|nr:hypothetical protein P691DRAFT_811024 [Macrolepiota fuliginosa MF-IS2]
MPEPQNYFPNASNFTITGTNMGNGGTVNFNQSSGQAPESTRSPDTTSNTSGNTPSESPPSSSSSGTTPSRLLLPAPEPHLNGDGEYKASRDTQQPRRRVPPSDTPVKGISQEPPPPAAAVPRQSGGKASATARPIGNKGI